MLPFLKYEGLGNDFLEIIENDADGMYHIVRAYPQPEVDHPIDHIDPIRDIEVANHELRQRDVETANKALEKIEQEMKPRWGWLLTSIFHGFSSIWGPSWAV